MDATPNTLIHARRVHETYRRAGGSAAVSRVKLIVVLREPVSRELSLYNHKEVSYLKTRDRSAWYGNVVYADNETVMPFEEYARRTLVDREGCKKCQREYHLGEYVDHLKEWLSYFAREQLLVLSYDELCAAPGTTQGRIQEFLGAAFPGALKRANSKGHEDKVRTVPPAARKILDPLFTEKNLELYEFLERHPGPAMEQRPFPRFRE